MNKSANEFLQKCKEVPFGQESPLLKGVFIIQQRKLHDSGYRMMYVIGHTDYDEKIKDFRYYLIGTYSDVVDFEMPLDKMIKGINCMCDLHLDINKDGIIHVWTRHNKHFVCRCPHLSNCVLEIVD